MWRHGATYAEIADALGISTGLVGNWLHRLRVADPTLPRRRPAPWSAEEDRRLSTLFEAGSTAEQIAADTGRPVWGVEGRIAHLGLRKAYANTWSKAEDDALERGFRAGLTVASLAENLGRTSHQVNTRIRFLRRSGRNLAARKPRWTEDDRRRLARRYREGATYKQLASEFGKSKGTISRQLRRMREAGADLERNS